MSITDRLLGSHEAYAASFAKGDLPGRPSAKLAVVSGMGARLDVYALLGLEEAVCRV